MRGQEFCSFTCSHKLISRPNLRNVWAIFCHHRIKTVWSAAILGDKVKAKSKVHLPEMIVHRTRTTSKYSECPNKKRYQNCPNCHPTLIMWIIVEISDPPLFYCCINFIPKMIAKSGFRNIRSPGIGIVGVNSHPVAFVRSIVLNICTWKAE